MRPPPRQIEVNLRREPVAAVVCGPTSGASIVFYYQLEDTASMNADYDWNTDAGGPDCTTRPSGFDGNTPYSRDGASGQLACAENDNGTTTLIWTNTQRNILTFAFQGYDPATVIDWWRSEAGPA